MTPPEIDIRAGMLVYATTSPPCRGTIRRIPEDFSVEEVIELGHLAEEPRKGYFPVYRVEKRGIDTLHAAEILGRVLKSRVTFGGMKDKRAVTTQYMSPSSSRRETSPPPSVEHELFKAALIGFSPQPVTRSHLLGNRFRIFVRIESGNLRDIVEEVYEKCRGAKLLNFFGYQRFGLRGMVNHRVGKSVIKGEFRNAVNLILCEPREGEGEASSESRRMAATGMYREALGLLSSGQDIERSILNALVRRGDDYLAALRAVPLKIRRFFVNAYQAYLFNVALSGAFSEGLDTGRAERDDNWTTFGHNGLKPEGVHGAKEPPAGKAIPLVQIVGYAYRDYGSRFDKIVTTLLADEGISAKEFYVKELEEVSSEGGFRHAPLICNDPIYEPCAGGAKLSFTLPKGEYATTLLRELIKPARPLDSGF